MLTDGPIPRPGSAELFDAVAIARRLGPGLAKRAAAHDRDDSFVADVARILARTGIESGRLELEITEGLLLTDVQDTIKKMRALSQLGVSFALDDFGTGYSSLSYLQQLPLHLLKIDRSFVCNLGADKGSEAIARTIVQIGQSLGLEVIAEGVETQRQWLSLAQMGCTQYQGYLFGRPAPLECFERGLASGDPKFPSAPALIGTSVG
jgi:EAL domain-containing protein (putative c-di-GMP-specific phosphodiesterase class I)